MGGWALGVDVEIWIDLEWKIFRMKPLFSFEQLCEMGDSACLSKYVQTVLQSRCCQYKSLFKRAKKMAIVWALKRVRMMSIRAGLG